MVYYNYTADTSPTSTADSVWYSWNTTATATSDSLGYGTLWTTWVTGGDYVKSGVDETWTSWVSDTAGRTGVGDLSIVQERCLVAPANRPVIERPRPNISQNRQSVRNSHAEARARAKDKAEVKAQELLLDLIGEDELEVYKKTGRLFVEGRRFNYIIKRDRLIGGIQRIEKDKIVDFCMHLDRKFGCPKTDNVIALKLAIEADERRVWEVGNRHGWHELPDRLPAAAMMGGG